MSIYRYIGFVAYACIVIAVFFPAFRPDSIISNGDISRSHYFYMTYLRDSVYEGRLPLWNPYTLLGQPFIANPSIAFWYPATWLFVTLPISTAFLVHIMFHLWWSMVGVYVAAKQLTKHRMSAWVAGLVFGLGGYTMAHVYGGNYDVLAAGSWIGWVMAGMFALAASSHARYVVGMSVAIGLQLLAGYSSMSLYTLTVVALISGLYSILARNMRFLLYIGIAIIGGVGLAAIQLLPNWELTARTIRSLPVDYPWASVGAIPFRNFLQLVLPFPFGSITDYRADGMFYWEHAMYVGWTAIFLAVFGLIGIVRVKRKTIRVEPFRLAIVCVALFAVWAASGRLAPIDLYYYLWRYVPVFSFIRIPGRFVYVLSAMIALMVGFGFDSLIRTVSSRLRFIVRVGIIAFLCVELYPYARTFIVTRPLSEITLDAGTVALLQNNLQPGERFSSGVSYDFGYDAPVAIRIPTVHGYDVTMLKDPYLFILAAIDVPPARYTEMDNYDIPWNHPVLRYLSVRYVLGNSSHVPDPGYAQVSNHTSPYAKKTVYRIKDTFPLWRIVYDGAWYASDSELYDAIRYKRHSYERTVGFVGTPPDISYEKCKNHADSQVAIHEVHPEYVRLGVRTACPGYVTGSQVYFPGWSAFVDGVSVPVFRGNLGFLAIVVPEGTHTVEFIYHSRFLLVGASVSVLSGCLLCYVYIYDRRKKKAYSR